MKVYIEHTLIINFIVDLCILTILSKLLFSHTSKKRIILSALFGSITTFIYPYLFNTFLINVIKILTATIMLQILHSMKFKKLILSLLLMLGLSYTIGGTIIANFATPTLIGYTVKSYNILLVVLLSIITSFITCKLIQYVKLKVHTNSHIHDVKLCLKNKTINVKSLIDSGNCLNDNCQPVSLINFDTFTKLTNISISDYLNNKFDSLNSPKFIFANTISGKRKILVFTIDSVTLINTNKHFDNVRIGVMLNFDNSKEYHAILNNSFCY